MTREITLQPLTAKAFAPFGDVIETTGSSFPINAGMCDRFHDRGRVEVVGDAARLGISIGHGRPYTLPVRVTLLERHPLGSQAFLPMTEDPFLVVVAPDESGRPGRPLAFLTDGHQGVNYLRNIWHGVLTPLGRAARFTIVDRVAGDGNNLEEYLLDEPWIVTAV